MSDFYDDPVRNNNIDMSKYLSNIYCSRFKEINKNFEKREDIEKKSILRLKDFIFCKLEKASTELKNFVSIKIDKKEFNDLIFQNTDDYLSEKSKLLNNFEFVKNILNSVTNEFFNQNINFSYSFYEFYTSNQQQNRDFLIDIKCSFNLSLDEDTSKLKNMINL